MTSQTASETRRSDYSLVGIDSARAVEKGLADAKWYTTYVPKESMRQLLERRDGPAIRDTLLWFALLLIFGYTGYLLRGAWWAILPFAIYGVLYASVSDSRWHESSHGTAFKTDWMNNALYELASFMVLRESVPWRWSHTRHHSDTIIVGRDPEIAVPRPANLLKVCLTFFNVFAFRMYVRNVFLHCTGRITPEERTYIPEAEFGKVIARARIYAVIYAGIFALALYTRSILPLLYVGLVSFYGAWLMVIYGLTQHAGLAENVLDHRLNCRTVYMNPIHRYLYWNMGYHVEHHMFPLVPYHALPKLHALVKADMPAPYQGILEAYREIVPTLQRQSKDAAYYVKRQLPPPVPRETNETAARTFTSEGRPVVDGWIEVCEGILLQKEDVLRFDHNGKTYAIYRAGGGQPYATDGICTHGNAHLADGLVKGTLIECAKHNGRYDVRDGFPQRLPVCVGLKTYAVRENDGKLYLDLTSAGGYAVTTPAVTYTFHVVSNHNVAAFIKELVLEPEPASPELDYRPGDYLQFDIPAYEERTLQDIDLLPAYAAAWQAQRAFDLKAANPGPCRRNYSIASNPATERQLRFNIRLATPPRGRQWYTGVGSAYLFGLKPGDLVTAIGPFGEFHVKDTGHTDNAGHTNNAGDENNAGHVNNASDENNAGLEMVYLGGGTGMAPLRSHLSYLLETRKTPARISYWYGARSLQDLYYAEYFEELARKNENFSFHVALSEPRPEDGWQSHTGFIHEVLKREYLDKHPDPQSIEYFLCGPPAMIGAATVMLKNLGVLPTQVFYDEF